MIFSWRMKYILPRNKLVPDLSFEDVLRSGSILKAPRALVCKAWIEPAQLAEFVDEATAAGARTGSPI